MNKILLIENEEDIREILREILTYERFEVIEADNGLLGVNLALETIPDLIICDIMMSGIDGYEVLQKIRNNSATSTISFIFLTAKLNKINQRRGMELGADDYLTKPFTKDEVLGAVTAQLEKKNILKRKSLEKIDELRLNIAYALPHELHTPLNVIINSSKFLTNYYQTIDQEQSIELLKIIHTSGERLYRITKNFLLYAELELTLANPERIAQIRSKQEYCYTQCHLKELCIKLAQQAERLEDLYLDISEVIVFIPDTKFYKIIEELLDNAFKFSRSGTPIRVTSKFLDNYLHLSIVDYGRGMTVAQIANIAAYNQFERKLYEQQGSGLGLTIAKRLVELYGGQFNIQSVVGQQTTVNVYLPGSNEKLSQELN
jgi:two-component system sensor histidine kinase/response regulator